MLSQAAIRNTIMTLKPVKFDDTYYKEAEINRLKRTPIGLFVNPEALEIHQEMLQEAHKALQLKS